METRNLLSFAVASGKAGYVFLQDGQVVDWGLTVKAVSSSTELVGFVQELITKLKPDVVVTEKCDDRSRKGERSRALIKSIAELASHNEVLDISVRRPRTFPSKYEEADYLVRKHPEVIGYLPDRKRRIFDFEPRGMMIFEAIALAEGAAKGRSKSKNP